MTDSPVRGSRTQKHQITERVVAVIFLLAKKPRTIGELMEILGKGRNDRTIASTMQRIVSTLESEGLVEDAGPCPTEGKNGRYPHLYRWVPPESKE